MALPDYSGVIASVIAAIVTVLIFVANTFVNRYYSGKPSVAVIYKKQLFQVFEPLTLILENERMLSPHDLVSEMHDVIYRNYSLIPQVLLIKYKIIKEQENLVDADLAELNEIVVTYYNWTKKKLAYPYFKKGIKQTWLIEQNQETNKRFELFQIAVSAALIVLVIIAMGLMIYNQIESNKLNSELMSLNKEIGYLEAEINIAHERINANEIK